MSGPFVLDASLAAAWLFPDEKAPQAEDLRRSATESHVLVPAIFPVEMQNILWTGELRKRITPPQGLAFWQMLFGLDVRVEAMPSLPPAPSLLALSRQFGLAAYDASYLELARRTGLSLATLDARLRTAASGLGLQVVP